MGKRLPSYVPVMLLVTGAYLTLEFPFSSRLVQVLASRPDQADIDSIESFGRVLTGIAVAIFLAGVFVFPRMAAKGRSLKAAILASLIIGSAATWGTYNVLDFVAHATGREASPEARREAFLSRLAASHIAATGDGFRRRDDNDWLAFVALAPSISDADRLLAASAVSTIELATAEARRTIGTPEAFRDQVFGKGFERVNDAYSRHREASRSYAEARSDVPRMADEAYEAFRSEIRRKYSQGVEIPSLRQMLIIRHVKFTLNVPVADDWRLDRAGFVGPYSRKASAEIERRYTENSTLHFGERLKPGMDIDYFAARPRFQEEIRRALDLPQNGAAVVPGMSAAQFEAAVWSPAIDRLAERLASALSASASEFSQGGRFQDEGVAAVKAVSLPAMAILLSIAGAILHVYKFSGYAGQMIGLRGAFSRHAFAFLASVVLLAGMAWNGNAVTDEKAYAEIRSGSHYGTVLTAAISIQPGFRQMADALGSIGGWQAFAGNLPQGSARVVETASTAPSGDALSPSGVQSLPDGHSAPLPVFRPA